MLKQRSNQKELMDDLSLNNDDLRKNLEELEKFNRWFGSHKVLINALNKVYSKYAPTFKNQPIVLADLCCGGGDLLRVMSPWAESKNLKIEFIGIDANPFMIEYAIHQSPSFTNIKYQTLDIFSPEFNQLQFDIVTINSSCHHFSDKSLLSLFTQLKRQTRLAIIINDLHRNWISYFTIKWLSKFLNCSYLAQHDAPLSVMRAFRKNELINILRLAEVKSYEIHWRWPFRWEVVIWL